MHADALSVAQTEMMRQLLHDPLFLLYGLIMKTDMIYWYFGGEEFSSVFKPIFKPTYP